MRRLCLMAGAICTTVVNLGMPMKRAVKSDATILGKIKCKSARVLSFTAAAARGKGFCPQVRRDIRANIFHDFDRVRTDIPN